MSELCKCGDGLSNLGVPSCKEGFDVAKRLIFVEQLDNDGNQNAIDVADVLDSTYLDGKFYNADKSQRWFITPDFDNVTDERADTETQTLDSGIELPLRQGQRTFTAFFQTLPASWGRKIGANACAKVGVYIVDTVGNIIGSESKDGTKLTPVKIASGTFNAVFVKKSNDSVQGWNITFTYDNTELDAYLKVISSDVIGEDLTSTNGILDVTLAETSGTPATTSTLSVDATLECYGNFGDRDPFVAGELTDFTLFNVTQSAAVVPSAVTQDPDGTYLITFPAQLSADVIRVSLTAPDVTGKGFEGANTVDVTIP